MLLSIKQIASWQIPTVQVPGSTIRAELPALQRGAVWRAPQMEALWDSVLRGFPIGAFLLAPVNAERGTKALAYATGHKERLPTTHHLLDGQQRSNALALGFLNPWSWTDSTNPPLAALWLDLQAPESKDEREFVFRVVTRAHPWGYRANASGSEGPRLSAATIRNAAKAYRRVYTGTADYAMGEFSLADVWPWDAHAPVPFCFLVEAVEQEVDVRKHVLHRLTDLPYWGRKLENVHGETWTQNVVKALQHPAEHDKWFLNRVIRGLQSVLGKTTTTTYQIPALMHQGIGEAPTREESTIERQDPVETLFIRVNAGGTRLEGEELVYSILKSIWPNAEKHIAEMNTRLAQPSRIVILASRLVLAAQEDAFQDHPPPAPDVARFRRLVNGLDDESKDFRDNLRDYFESGWAGKVFAKAREILTENKHCALPPVLAADVARRSPEIMFVFLRWIEKMLRDNQNPADLRRDKMLRTIGVITALSWFSENPDYCVANLWRELQSANGQTLRLFFDYHLESCYRLRKGKLGLLPLVPPKMLASVIDANILERHGFETPTSKLWDRWSWEYDITISTSDDKLGSKLSGWYKKEFAKSWARPDEDEESESASSVELETLYQQAWEGFINTLWDERRLLLFAQREWLMEWFPKYDPTSQDQMDESDRPWDFDHIHPSAHIEKKRNVPTMIRAWHGCIGNLRAWPLQANRGDGDKSPSDKLTSLTNLGDFGIKSESDLHQASFVDEDWEHWKQSCPEPMSPGYLGKPSEFGVYRKNLMRAILTRFLRIYQTWYETFRIGE